MKFSFLLSAFFAILFLFSCKKESEPVQWVPNYDIPVPLNPGTPNTPTDRDSLILVDASRDGGLWWYPQYGTYSSTSWHQGTALADLMRSRGFVVNELPRGTRITWQLLSGYNKIIRCGGFGTYDADELAAYDSFLNRSSSLLLINDHLQNSPNDALSARLGLHFTGSVTGVIDAIPNHAITNGVTTIPYIAGSVITQPHLDITALGNVNGTAVAMGIRNHPTSKIFFIGDGNGLQQLPQPFTGNLFKWLFNL